MNDKEREYHARAISVTWSQTRCIHVASCVQELPQVFDTEKKPWIQPDQADVDEVAHTVLRCPTGALHFRREDGVAEEVPDKNTVRVAPNGPLFLRGDIQINAPDGSSLNDTRIALCRCGATAHGPLCDGSHKDANFKDRGELGNVTLGTAPTDTGKLEVSPTPDGPLMLRGPFELTGSDGEREGGHQTALCRCGASGNKPFCDGSHSRVGFISEEGTEKSAVDGD